MHPVVAHIASVPRQVRKIPTMQSTNTAPTYIDSYLILIRASSGYLLCHSHALRPSVFKCSDSSSAGYATSPDFPSEGAERLGVKVESLISNLGDSGDFGKDKLILLPWFSQAANSDDITDCVFSLN